MKKKKMRKKKEKHYEVLAFSTTKENVATARKKNRKKNRKKRRKWKTNKENTRFGKGEVCCPHIEIQSSGVPMTQSSQKLIHTRNSQT